MTWKECKLAALQKMFAAEGNAISADVATEDYLAAMPAAANEALQLIAEVQPLRRSAMLPAAPCTDLPVALPDFRRSGSVEVYRKDASGLPWRVWEAAVSAGRYLLLPAAMEGQVEVFYDAMPLALATDSPEDTPLPLPPEAGTLVPLYMASQLYKNDDLATSTIYRNEFEYGLEKLMRQNVGVRAGGFGSASGWL